MTTQNESVDTKSKTINKEEQHFILGDIVHISIQIFGEPHNFTFDSDATVSQVIKQIVASDINIPNPEAFGLCFPEAFTKASKKEKKKKAKNGSFRDPTKWLDDNYSLRFYANKGMLQDHGALVFKVKNNHLSKARAVHVLVPSLNSEVTITYNYMTTVGDMIRCLLELDDDSPIDSEWSLLLPIGRKDGLMMSLNLDPSRTLQSYDLSPSNTLNEIRKIVLTNNPAELNHLSSLKFEENELEMWWITRIKKDQWKQYRPNVNHKQFEKLKTQVRKGVPGPLRGDVWPILTGARDLMVSGEYASYKERPIPQETQDRIKRDLHRTLPFHPYFQTEHGRNQLFGVLSAYASREPRISYCQGMNFIVGVMLLTMNEELTYWCFCSLMTVYGMKEFFGDNVPLLSTSLIQFQRCIEIMNPLIWVHFEEESINLNLFATPWFLTLFAYDSQLEFLHRLWDIFFNEGFSIIFRTAMAILREGEDLLMKYDIIQVKDYFQYAPRQITAPDLILNAAFKVPKCKFMHKVFTKAELAAIEGGGKGGKNIGKEEVLSGMYHPAASAVQSSPQSSVVMTSLKSKNPNGIAKSSDSGKHGTGRPSKRQIDYKTISMDNPGPSQLKRSPADEGNTSKLSAGDETALSGESHYDKKRTGSYGQQAGKTS